MSKPRKSEAPKVYRQRLLDGGEEARHPMAEGVCEIAGDGGAA